VQEALDLVADLSAPHTLGTLTTAVALSPSRLAHLYNRGVGDSVGETLLILRLRQGARLLPFTMRPVGDTAADIDFPNPLLQPPVPPLRPQPARLPPDHN